MKEEGVMSYFGEYSELRGPASEKLLFAHVVTVLQLMCQVMELNQCSDSYNIELLLYVSVL